MANDDPKWNAGDGDRAAVNGAQTEGANQEAAARGHNSKSRKTVIGMGVPEPVLPASAIRGDAVIVLLGPKDAQARPAPVRASTPVAGSTQASPGAYSQSVHTGPEHVGPIPRVAAQPLDSSPPPQQQKSAPPSSRRRADTPAAFDPSRAYPDAPAAQPYTGARRSGIPVVRPVSPIVFQLGIVLPLLAAPAVGALSVRFHALLPVALLLVWTSWSLALVLVHRAWSAIQDGAARTSPGRAVWLLLVPVFNLYWAFQAFAGFATDYNHFIERHSVDAQPISKNLVLATMVVPGVGLLLAWRVIGSVCAAINAIWRVGSRTTVKG